MRSEIVGRDEILGAVEEILGRAEIAGEGDLLGWTDDGTAPHEILGLEEILGREEILGDAELDALMQQARPHKIEDLDKTARLIKLAELVRKDRSPVEKTSANGCDEILGLEEILGGAFVGDDELALAAEGGSAEREALARRLGDDAASLAGARPQARRSSRQAPMRRPPPKLRPAPRRVDPAKTSEARAKTAKMSKMRAGEMSLWIKNFAKKNGYITSQMLEDMIIASKRAHSVGPSRSEDQIRQRILDYCTNNDIEIRD